MKKLFQGLTAFIYIMSFSLLLSHLKAAETVPEKIGNKVNEVKKDAKQEGSAARRDARNKAGKGSVKKDLKDAGNNAKDEVEYQADKVKDKVDD